MSNWSCLFNSKNFLGTVFIFMGRYSEINNVVSVILKGKKSMVPFLAPASNSLRKTYWQ